MKNLILFYIVCIALLSFSQTTSAQTVGQGSWMFGGSAGFSSLKPKDADGSLTTISLAPNIGYFIADDLAVGLTLDVTSINPPIGDAATFFSVGPFVRYYFVDPIFVQAHVNLGLGDDEFTEFQLGVGYSWFINDGVAIEPMLFYNSHGADGEAGDFSIFGLHIGVQAFANHDHGME